MALSADTPRNMTIVGRRNALSVQASSIIYAGSAVTLDASGDVGPLSASDANFAGFAVSQTDNSSGAAGDTKADILTNGEVELVVTGFNNDSQVDDIVYATDDDTFTLTASGGQAIGRVSQTVDTATNKCRVLFKSIVDEHWND